MSKLRLLAENFLIYGVGGVISKMVPLIMTPIIVRLMPDSACYGVNDLSNTMTGFGIFLKTRVRITENVFVPRL